MSDPVFLASMYLLKTWTESSTTSPILIEKSISTYGLNSPTKRPQKPKTMVAGNIFGIMLSKPYLTLLKPIIMVRVIKTKLIAKPCINSVVKTELILARSIVLSPRVILNSSETFSVAQESILLANPSISSFVRFEVPTTKRIAE